MASGAGSDLVAAGSKRLIFPSSRRSLTAIATDIVTPTDALDYEPVGGYQERKRSEVEVYAALRVRVNVRAARFRWRRAAFAFAMRRTSEREVKRLFCFASRRMPLRCTN